MEILPPSYTGDPNAARCSESAFKYGFFCFNAAIAYDRIGLKHVMSVGHAFSGDYLVALSEEVRAQGRGTRRGAQEQEGEAGGVRLPEVGALEEEEDGEQALMTAAAIYSVATDASASAPTRASAQK